MRPLLIIFSALLLFAFTVDGFSAGLSYGTVTTTNGDFVSGATVSLTLDEPGRDPGCGCDRAGCGEGDQEGCGCGDCDRGGCGGGDCDRGDCGGGGCDRGDCGGGGCDRGGDGGGNCDRGGGGGGGCGQGDDGIYDRTQTDDHGNYQFHEVESGTYFIVVEADGFVYSENLIEIDGGESVLMDFVLLREGELGVDDRDSAMPEILSLISAYPNPFNSSTTIMISMPESDYVSVVIYNLRGQNVGTIYRGSLQAGETRLALIGSGMSTGTYLISAETTRGIITQIIYNLK